MHSERPLQQLSGGLSKASLAMLSFHIFWPILRRKNCLGPHVQVSGVESQTVWSFESGFSNSRLFRAVAWFSTQFPLESQIISAIASLLACGYLNMSSVCAVLGGPILVWGNRELPCPLEDVQQPPASYSTDATNTLCTVTTANRPDRCPLGDRTTPGLESQ